jgi:hypothetical protein
MIELAHIRGYRLFCDRKCNEIFFFFFFSRGVGLVLTILGVAWIDSIVCITMEWRELPVML